MSETNSGESFSFVKAEEQILNSWNKEKTFQKSLDQTRGKKPYIFYDGPPFATGLPHHGHMVASTLKDIIPRYYTMKGHYVERRFGWDTHGLPIEQQIDKKFGMSANDYVEKNGIKAYCDACRSIVLEYTAQWEKTVNRIGRWVDFENDYKTMDASFMESVWWVFKQAWDKGLIYKGNKIVPYSVALETGLSNFEATQNYQDVQDPAVTVLFKVDNEDAYFAAWTTTPWTLPSNLGLIVNESIDYVLVKHEDKNIYMAKARLESYQKHLELEVINELKGKDLIGKTYEPLFDYFKEEKANGAFKVYADDYVTTEDGTGIVHAAPAYGEDDHRVLTSNGFKSVVNPINSKAEFTAEVTDFAGMYIKDADKEITKKLKQDGKLLWQSTIVHSYPFCYRTDTPLIYMAMPQWYLNVDEIKDRMIANNKKINWVPEHIKEGRFGKWLENARDWAISRNRFWGTPLPVWENETNGKFVCVGSIEELKEMSGVQLNDLHREFVDEVTFTIEGEEGVYKRIPEVFDCWFESGSMPYAQLHYPFENQEVFDNGFPAEFIAEGLDQTRGWFYTLTVLSTTLFDKPAFKNVIVNGMVMAEDGKKMSKRLKNYTEPDILMNKHGADALRLTFINSGIVRGEELRFGDDLVKDMVRKALLPWFNAFKFFQTYAAIDDWKFDKNLGKSENILDQWVVSKIQHLINEVNTHMADYKLYLVVPQLFNFIEDLTNWYIRLNRRRYWASGMETDKQQAFQTLHLTLRELSKVMAPFAPFLSDYIYRELKAFEPGLGDSVHLASFPDSSESNVNESLEEAVKTMQELIVLGRQERVKAKIKVKTPLNELKVVHSNESLLNGIKKLEVYIKTELNIKNIAYDKNEENYIAFTAKPNAPILGKKLGKEFGKFAKAIKSLDSESCKKSELGESVTVEGKEFDSSELLIFRQPKDERAASNQFVTIVLDTELTPELIQEGKARELVNLIQKARKDANTEVSARVSLTIKGSAELKEVSDKFKGYIEQETLSELNYQVAEGETAIEIQG